jgi:2-methylcitrate dehydratase PrpD
MREDRERQGYPLLSHEVESVEIQATIFTWLMDMLAADSAEGPLTPVAVNFSSPLTAAVALLHGRLHAEEFTTAALARDERQLRALARRVRVRLDPELTLQAIDHFEETVGAVRAVAGLGPLALSQFALGAGLFYGSVLRQSLPLIARSALLKRLLFGLLRREHFDLADANMGALRWPFGARVSVRLRSGEVLTGGCTEPRGGPGDPHQQALVLEKLQREAGRLLGPARAKLLAARVLGDCDLCDTGELLDLACEPRVRALG